MEDFYMGSMKKAAKEAIVIHEETDMSVAEVGPCFLNRILSVLSVNTGKVRHFCNV